MEYKKERNLKIRPFRTADEEAVVQLWKNCDLVVPWNDPHRDILCKMKVRPDMFLIGCVDEEVVASVMVGYEGHRGWINYLAVNPELQRKGIARRMMDEAEKLLRAAGCPKINLQVRTSNKSVIEFYERIGYTVDDLVSMGKRLEPDE